MRCRASLRRGHYLCGWNAFALDVYISSCEWECCVEVGVNKSANVCVNHFAADGEGVSISAFVCQELVNFNGGEIFCLGLVCKSCQYVECYFTFSVILENFSLNWATVMLLLCAI